MAGKDPVQLVNAFKILFVGSLFGQAIFLYNTQVKHNEQQKAKNLPVSNPTLTAVTKSHKEKRE